MWTVVTFTLCMVKIRTCILIQPVTYVNSSDIYSVYGQNQNMYSYSTGHLSEQ
jgi:hypothetical protein